MIEHVSIIICFHLLIASKQFSFLPRNPLRVPPLLAPAAYPFYPHHPHDTAAKHSELHPPSRESVTQRSCCCAITWLGTHIPFLFRAASALGGGVAVVCAVNQSNTDRVCPHF